MAFLNRKEFTKYPEAIVVTVYSDRISVYRVEKNTTGFNIIVGVTEKQEEARLNDTVGQGELNAGSAGSADSPQASSPQAEKIKLNCQKALQQLPREHMKSGMPIVFALGPGISKCAFVSVDAKREQKDAIISEDEVKSIIKKSYGLKASEGDMISRNFPAGFLVDGFSVPDPVGLNGQNITVNLISVSAHRALEEMFSSVASLYGLRYAGMLNICSTLADAMPLFTPNTDCVVVLVFQRETDIVLVRGGKIVAIGKADSGYGILEQEAATLFSVGIEEAKNIARSFERNQTDAVVAKNISDLFARVIPDIAQRIGSVLPMLDSEHLIPATFLVAQFGHLSRVSEALINNPKWLAQAPVARNAQVARMSPLKQNIQDDKRMLADGDLYIVTALVQS